MEVTTTQTSLGYSIEAKSACMAVSATISLQSDSERQDFTRSEHLHNSLTILEYSRFLLQSAKDFENLIREQFKAQQLAKECVSSQTDELSFAPLPIIRYSPVFYDATRPDIVLTRIPKPEDMPAIPVKKSTIEWQYALFKIQPEYHIGQAILRSADRCLTSQEVVAWLDANVGGFPARGQLEWRHFADRCIRYHLSSVSPYFNRLQMQGPTAFGGMSPTFNYMYEVKPGQEFRFIKPIIAKPGKPFQFMKLPVEIRHMIYKNILVFEDKALRVATYVPYQGERAFGGRTMWVMESDEISAYPIPNGEGKARVVINDVMAIVSASKAVFNEALPIFYRYNKIVVSARDLKKFTSGLGPERVSLIKDLVFILGNAGHKEGCRALYQCSELETLHIIVNDISLNISGASRGKVSGWGYRPLWQRNIKSVSGMDWLAAIRGMRKFTCSDDGKQTYKYLKDFLTKPKGWTPPKNPRKSGAKKK